MEAQRVLPRHPSRVVDRQEREIDAEMRLQTDVHFFSSGYTTNKFFATNNLQQN
jgi:hypothetical protein